MSPRTHIALGLIMGLALLVPTVSAQSIPLGAPSTSTNATSTNATTTPDEEAADEDAAPTFPTEEFEGIVEVISPIYAVINYGENNSEIRKIRLGNPGAVLAIRDGEEVALEAIQPGDAAIVTYATRAAYRGIIESASAEALVITTPEGRELTFAPSTDLEVKFQVQPGIRATGAGIPQIIAGLTPGSEIEVTYRGESVVEIEAYSDGKLPRAGGWIIPVLIGLIVIVGIGIFYVRGRRKNQVDEARSITNS